MPSDRLPACRASFRVDSAKRLLRHNISPRCKWNKNRTLCALSTVHWQGWRTSRHDFNVASCPLPVASQAAIYLPHAPPAPRQHPTPAPLARQVGQAGAAARRTARAARPRPSARPRKASPRRRRRRSCPTVALDPPRAARRRPALAQHREHDGVASTPSWPSPHERSERARQVLAEQPMIANHPLVSGGLPAFIPHRPPRPDKSEGGIAFKLVSEYEPKGDQPTAIAELVDGVNAARAQPGAARRHRLGQDLHRRAGHRAHAAARP